MNSPYDTVVVSGGFDPIHIGHVRMIIDAARHGNVIVVANSDAWLMRKKGYIFMPFEERQEILASIKGVLRVESVDDIDGTVCEALRRIKPTHFANGGDRKQTNTPEMDVCNELGINLLWNIGGGKIQSSSDLVKAAKDKNKHWTGEYVPGDVWHISAKD
jgi:D-beta-D-heptose 7-phosphate kinase/D-beta-D-heptose 1-phosphate adenosyltransferase